MLDEIGFQPLGRRIVVGQRIRSKEPSADVWLGSVLDFLSNNLPCIPEGGWGHLYIAAYEAACEALVALGHAVEIDGGAQSVAEPTLPSILPRWDDIATAVVCVASQNSLLEYRLFAGARDRPSPEGLLKPNIRAAHGSGPAYLATEAIPVFQSLGLVLNGRWTQEAETVLWRDFPWEWGIDFTIDRRFVRASDVALAAIPEDVAAEIEKLATISEKDVMEWLEVAEWHAPTPKTWDDALKSLQIWSRLGLDRLFYKRWRLSDGWLSAEDSKRALLIQWDPVATNMRREFMARYMPELPFVSE